MQATKAQVPFEHCCVVQVSVEQLLPFCEGSGSEAQVPSPTLVVELPPHAACWHAAGVVPGHVGWSAVFPSVSTTKVFPVVPYWRLERYCEPVLQRPVEVQIESVQWLPSLGVASQTEPLALLTP